MVSENKNGDSAKIEGNHLCNTCINNLVNNQTCPYIQRGDIFVGLVEECSFYGTDADYERPDTHTTIIIRGE